ncbi:hypothetical protein BJ165DRAFT_1533162 [Panaeolus papilionaceus]|nr:hypothetical protein BJ165DRAFT_1533162 [Panaeolus papilionaceus]
MELPVLTNLLITGHISIEPVTGQVPNSSWRYLIMGPTGAGKSSFIEALRGESQQLSISKDQLAGYTQSINAYRVVDVNYVPEYPVYLIDSPGFSDSKISEIEIMDKVKKWLSDNDLEYVSGILFLIPITETRLPGSRRKTIEMLRQFLGSNNEVESVTFVTTMWDTVHNERTRTRAESNFAQLRDEVCKGFFGAHQVVITRFMNTKSSALEVLNREGYYAVNSFFSPTSSASSNLYKDLHERIEGALQEKKMIESDLAQPQAQTDTELRTILERNQMENQETLTKFIRQFVNFGPLPAEFSLAAQHLRKSIAANVRPEHVKYRMLFWQWAHEPEISDDTNISSVPSQKLSLKGLLRPLGHTPKRHKAGSSKRGE